MRADGSHVHFDVYMKTYALGVSEVRRRLPELVESIARDGGRVDVTCRGESRVSLVRTADLDGAGRSGAAPIEPALRVEFAFPAVELIDVLQDARLEWGAPRPFPAEPPVAAPKRSKPYRRAPGR